MNTVSVKDTPLKEVLPFYGEYSQPQGHAFERGLTFYGEYSQPQGHAFKRGLTFYSEYSQP